MTKALDFARRNLLESSGLDENHIGDVLGSLMMPGVDDAELYFQHSRGESWSLEDGIVKEAGYSVERGVGVRAVAGEKTGFAYSDEIMLPALTDAGKAARASCAPARTGVCRRGARPPGAISTRRTIRRR